MVYDKWMMKQSSGKCASSSSEALVQAKDLEAKFLTSLSARGVLDTSVRSLCSNIRDVYESIILSDHAFAEAQNVEHFLWQLHYRQIEAFRHLISSDKEWSIAHDGRGNAACSKEKWTDLLQSKPALAGFRSFLVEASGFYHELITKLRVSCGLALDLWHGVDYHKSEAAKLKRCQQSCYRCLVNLGDYARYKEFYVGSDPSSYNFSIAADFYRQAIAHFPVGGQPHNQLAVLAVYVEDELLAVYHYFRSLAVEKPFPTTRENLTILFDKNRVKYEELPPVLVKPALPPSRPIPRKTPEGVKSNWVSKSTRRIPAKQTGRELISCFFVRFVRLNGLFFTKTSLEKFEEVFAGVLHDLQQILALNDKDLELALGSGSCFGMAPETHSAFGSIKLVVILICTLESVNCGPRNTQAPKQNVLVQNASIALLAVVGQLLQRCAETQKASDSPLLPAMLVFLEWLSCRPDIVRGFDKDDEQFKLLSFIWKQFIKLLNRLCNETKFKKAYHDSKEASTVGVALWEDFELQGFSPMSSAHVTLSYRERPKERDTDITKDHQSRVQRFVATGNALASIAEGSNMGLLFSQAITKCHFIKGKQCDHGSGENNKSRRPVDGAVVTQIKDEVESWHNKQTCRDDDDDEEELIVFRPAAKEQLVMVTSAAASEPLNDTASFFQKATPSCEPSLTVLPSYSVSDVIETSFAPNPECLPNPSTLYDASSVPLKSDAMSLHSKDLRNLTSIGSETEQFKQSDIPKVNKQANLPFFEQPSRNQPMRGSIHHVNDIESSSSLGLRKSLGVIGEPKQILTTMAETGGSNVKGSNKLHDDVHHRSAVSPTVDSFLQKLPPLLSEMTLSKEVQGRSHAGIASKLAESAPYFQSAFSNQASSFTSPVMCPPPGFGPRPTIKHPGYSLWSDDSNKVLQSGGETLSSPCSMPLFSLSDEKRSPAVHLQRSSQMTNEKETWSLFGSTAGFNWNPSILS